MISSRAPRGSKRRAQKPRSLPSDLGEQFLDLQRLRQKVHELEKLVASGRRHLLVMLGRTSRNA